jgi:hypothetical protein
MIKVKAVVNHVETILYAEVESGQSVLMALQHEAVTLLNDINLLNSEVPTCLFIYDGHGFRVQKTGFRHWEHDGFSFDKFDVKSAVKQGIILPRTARPL